MLSCENHIFYQPLQSLYKAFTQNYLIEITHFVVMLKRALHYHGTIAVRVETESINFINPTSDYNDSTDQKSVRILASFLQDSYMHGFVWVSKHQLPCTVHSDVNYWPFPSFF